MKIYKLLILCFILLSLSCKDNKQNDKNLNNNKTSVNEVEVQGHRGDRGNFPENSIPAFISAVEKGADVLELDVVISRDKKVVVSHEPYMLGLYMQTPEGDSISKENEQKYNLYTMNYDSIRKFDSGSRGNRLFPKQQKQSTYKPLLGEVMDSVKNFISKNDLDPIKYNIEIKSTEDKYGAYQPDPEEFVDIVMKVLTENRPQNKFNLQSFDVNILKILNANYPEVELAYLVSGEGIDKNLNKLNFTPNIYSPNFKLVKDEKFVDSINKKGMKLIPWTVNEPKDIENMIDLRVDGIITDYPERVIER